MTAEHTESDRQGHALMAPDHVVPARRLHDTGVDRQDGTLLATSSGNNVSAIGQPWGPAANGKGGAVSG